MSTSRRALVWFTKDLRLQDNVVLRHVLQNSLEFVGVAFEPQNKSSIASAFYLESAIELQRQLRELNVPFYILKGSPEIEIPILVQQNLVDQVVVQEAFNVRDKKVINRLKLLLGVERVKTIYNQTLLELADLPFEAADMPLNFTEFRKTVEKLCRIRAPDFIETDKLRGFSVSLPDSMRAYQCTSNRARTEFSYDLLPGETSGRQRVKEYFFDTQCLSNYKNTRNGMLNKNDSSKFSPWLSNGALSAKYIYEEIKKFEQIYGPNESTKWFVMELLWRDYFKFLSLKIGDGLFAVEGIRSHKKVWREDPHLFQSWCDGRTHIDFVDAHMRELKKTGWMSNRGRQNVASYLAKIINMNWTWGAQYFEQNLIDDDTESNWGNWLYLAGVGTDPRDRVFNIEKQAQDYDPEGEYRKKWLHETKS